MLTHIQSSFKWKFASEARFDAKFAPFRIFFKFLFPPFHVLSIFIIFVLISSGKTKFSMASCSFIIRMLLIKLQEILDNYDLFVGSQATDFGEALTRHDEF